MALVRIPEGGLHSSRLLHSMLALSHSVIEIISLPKKTHLHVDRQCTSEHKRSRSSDPNAPLLFVNTLEMS